MFYSFLLALYISVFAHSLRVSKPKLCINCKYSLPNQDGVYDRFSKCALFNTTTTYKDDSYLVTGIDLSHVTTEYKYCSTARWGDHLCGEEGTYYTPLKNSGRRADRMFN